MSDTNSHLFSSEEKKYITIGHWISRYEQTFGISTALHARKISLNINIVLNNNTSQHLHLIEHILPSLAEKQLFLTLTLTYLYK